MRPVLPSAFEPGLSWLRIRTIVRLRWIAVLGQTATVVGVYWGLGFDLPIGACLLAISLSAWLNIYLRARYPGRERMPHANAAAVLGYDVLQLSVLLYLTGGLENPFAFLIVAPVTVSAATQPPRTTLALGVLAVVCVSVLTVFRQPLPWYSGQSLELPLTYIAGVWTALVSTAIFLSLYAWRIAKETRQMADALTATEMALLHEQKLSALDGLAAAAAHELGTPLGTIQVVTKELLNEVPEDGHLREDVELLRSQAERCREILARLTRRSGQDDTMFSRVPLTHLLESVVENNQARDVALTVTATGSGSKGEPVAPRNPGVLYGLGNLVENAVEFASEAVSIEARWDDETASVSIVDDGPGIAAQVLERLGEPYVTSRPAIGEDESVADNPSGLGLGVFIAKTLLERSGARLDFSNRRTPARGAVVTITWPRDELESAASE